jgi:hypothetical protein
MANRISVLIDVLTDKARVNLKSFTSSIREADTLSGKWKAGFGQATDFVKQNAASLAVAGGTAMVAFGAKAVQAFTDTSKAAIDLGKATGLSTEEASRWIAVGDDFEVTASDIAAGLKGINRTIDDAKWAKYGIATRDAQGKVRDMNAILLDAFDKLGDISNATERAKVGTELFGKGFASIAPMIGKSRAEYERMLGAVEDGQVITDEEAKKAEEWRLALDKLKDSLNEVTLAIGSEVAELAPYLSALADVVSKLQEFDDTAGRVGMAQGARWSELLTPLGQLKDGFQAMWEQGIKSADKMAPLEDRLKGLSDAWLEGSSTGQAMADKMKAIGDQRDAVDTVKDAAAAATDYKNAQQELADALDRTRDAQQELYDTQRSAIDTQYAFRDAQRDYTQALEDFASAADDPKTAVDEYAESLDKAAQSALSVADANVAAAEETAKLEGRTLTAAEKNQIQIDSLKVMAASLGPGSDLRRAIEGHIATLEGTQKKITTTFDVDTALALGKVAIMIAKMEALKQKAKEAQTAVHSVLGGSKVPI